MSKNKTELHLFEAYGIELEYMIVDAVSLDVKPIADELFKAVSGSYVSDYNNREISWSNELVNHVFELKTAEPTVQIQSLHEHFHKNIREINAELEALGARLMPTAMHPWMNPFNETQIWKHEYAEIYDLYNQIFDCKRHGWANLQSMHINLPFWGDAEFERLHAAIRLILPLIPAIAASSPFMEGKNTGLKDTRLEVYRHNQDKIPSLTGKVIPEQVFTKEEYHQKVFKPILDDIRPFDPDHIMDGHFLNSRGAIARFDRNAIEIRLIDVQESPRADVAVFLCIVSVLKLFCLERWADVETQKSFSEDDLLKILLQTIQKAEDAVITDIPYLRALGISKNAIRAGEIWQHLFEVFKPSLTDNQVQDVQKLLQNGTLSSRMLKNCPDSTRTGLYTLFDRLTDCLADNTFLGS